MVHPPDRPRFRSQSLPSDQYHFLFTVEITAILVIRDLILCIAVLLAVSILQNVFDIIVVLLDDLVFNKALHFLVDLVQLSSQITNFSFLQTHVIH